jgi:hypothetical protein
LKYKVARASGRQSRNHTQAGRFFGSSSGFEDNYGGQLSLKSG